MPPRFGANDALVEPPQAPAPRQGPRFGSRDTPATARFGARDTPVAARQIEPPERPARLVDQLFAGFDEYRANRQTARALRTVRQAAGLAKTREKGFGQSMEILRGQLKLARELGRTEEVADLEQRLAAAEQALEDPERLARFDQARSLLTRSLQDAIDRQAELRGRAATVPLSKATREFAEAEGFREAFGEFGDDPIRIVAELGVRSAPNMLEIIPAAIGGAFVGGPVGGALAAGGGSAMVEYRASVAQSLQEAGVDLNDAESLIEAAADTALMEEVYRKAAIRAGIIGAADAATFGVAGRMLTPFKQPLARELTNLPAQAVVQAVGGAGGEAGAQLATEGRLRAGEVLAEGFAEAVTAPLDVATAAAAGIRETAVEARQRARERRLDVETQTAEDVLAFARERQAELEGRPELSAEEQRELDFLRSDGANPVTVAQAYGLKLEPGAELLNRGDVESPIPTELIRRGKTLVNEAVTGEARQEEPTREARLPESAPLRRPAEVQAAEEAPGAPPSAPAPRADAELLRPGVDRGALRDERLGGAERGPDTGTGVAPAGAPAAGVATEPLSDAGAVGPRFRGGDRVSDTDQTADAESPLEGIPAGSEPEARPAPLPDGLSPQGQPAAGEERAPSVPAAEQDGTAPSQEGAGSATGGVESPQFRSYRDWINEQPPEKLAESGGMLEQIRMDERLEDGEAQQLETLWVNRSSPDAKTPKYPTAPTADQQVTTPEPAKTTVNPPLTIEPYTDKSIIVRGQTRENLDRIKAAAGVRPLWNKKAGGWVFPKKREAEVRQALADLLEAPRPAAQALRGRKIDDEWVEFAPETGTLNVPRDDMPQVKAEHRGALANFLKARGIEGAEDTVAATTLKPTQREFSEKKVAKAKAFEGGDRAILVSSDGYVLDGHHQWIAKADQGEDIRIIRLDAPIKRLLEVVPEFPSQEGGTPEIPLTISYGSTPISGPGAAPAADQAAEAAPVGLSEALGQAPESVRLAREFSQVFMSGEKIDSIADARRYAASVLGRPVKPGTAEAKLVDEAVELGAVLWARSLVATSRSPQDAYTKLVALYGQMPRLGTRTSTSIAEQAYSTPLPLAYVAAQAAGITSQTSVYEPSAGNGALLLTAPLKRVTANELNADRSANLKATLPDARITTHDAAAWKPPGEFDVVIGNPPFGVVRDDQGRTKRFKVDAEYETGEIDHAITMQALDVMKDDGAAVFLVGSIAKTNQSEEARSDAYNSKAKREFYLKLYQQYNVVDHFTVAGELYEKQGAGWPIDVIVIRGRGKSAKPVPAVEPPRIYDSWEALAEVLDAEYKRPEAPVRRPLRGSDSLEQEPGRGDGPDRRGGRAGRPDREQDAARPSEPAGVRDRPVDREPGGPRPAEPAPREPEEAAPSPRAERRARTAPLVAEGTRQVPYKPASRAPGMGTLVPVNMQTAIQDALDRLQARVGNIEQFVADRLGYQPDELGDYFGAEQVDALALGIDNLERGAGFITGDQTGIGKGRVVAGIIRYAIRSGRVPVFITEKPNLYGDMYRDLTDIGIQKLLGREPEILMTNAAESVPLDDDGERVLKTASAGVHNKLLDELAREGLGGRYDMVFSTYSQMQTVKGDATARMRFLEAMANGGIVIFDESHNAGGTVPQREGKKPVLNRSVFARNLARIAHGVFYSSATYAKRPDVMDLYASTDMRLAVSDPSKLGEAIAKGGVPMQQVVASMLAGAGQYVRRERSFDGIVYNAPVVNVDRQTYANYSRALAAIQKFSETFIPAAAERLDKELKAGGKSISHDGSTGGAGAKSTSFTSIMHNLIDQMLLAITADASAERAIQAIKNGEKPVITVANTMGSFIADYVEGMNVNPGEKVAIDFNLLLLRYLERTRWLTIRKPFQKGPAEKFWLDDEALGPIGVRQYEAAQKLIRGMDFGKLPVSPIDHIKARIESAGYKVGEITGRNHTLEYRKDGAYYKIRSTRETSIRGRRKTISGFNRGDLDALIINQAGSTGLSLHASERFKDQRKRRMILAQAEKNIDTHMQMLGRVNRTGQVVLPEYDQLVADVPAVKRPAAVLSKKMASLNANTTAARGHALKAENVPDFMNEYGDLIAARLMLDNPEIHTALGEPLGEPDADGYDTEDAARKVTGRIPLLPIEQQEALYEQLESEYEELVRQKEAAGESVLEAKTLDLDAQVKSRTQVIAPQGGGSPFADGVYVEEASVKRLGKPHSTDQVLGFIAEELKLDRASFSADNMEPAIAAGRQAAQQLYREAMDRFRAYRAELVDAATTPEVRASIEARMDGMATRFQDVLRVTTVGQSVRLQTVSGIYYGVVIKVEQKGQPKNPLALGSWKVTMAMADSSKRLTLPMSQLEAAQVGDVSLTRASIMVEKNILSDLPTIKAFDVLQTQTRENRTIITGNLLAGFEHVGGRGNIVNFTDAEGGVRQGILMPRGFNYAKSQADLPVPLRTADQVLEFIRTGKDATSTDKAIAIREQGAGIRIEVAQAKAAGAQYYLNKAVLAAIGQDFVSVGGKMRADVPEGKARPAIDALKRAGAAFQAVENLGAARKIAGTTAPTEEAPAGDEAFSLGGDATDTALDPLGFFSGLRRAAEGLKQERGTGEQLPPELRERVSREGLPLFTLTPAARTKLDATMADLQERLRAVGIADRVGLELAAVITNARGEIQPGARGKYTASKRLIEVAMYVTGKMGTLNHEIIHALKDLGVIRDAEWRTLTDAVLADQPLMTMIRARYTKVLREQYEKAGLKGAALESTVEAKIIEEAIAEKFRYWTEGTFKPKGFVRTAFERIRAFFEAIRNAFRGQGFQTAEDIFQRIDRGEFGRRPSYQRGGFKAAKPATAPAGANVVPPRALLLRQYEAVKKQLDALHAKRLPGTVEDATAEDIAARRAHDAEVRKLTDRLNTLADQLTAGDASFALSQQPKFDPARAAAAQRAARATSPVARAGEPPFTDGFANVKESLVDLVRYKLQDKYIDLKRVQAASGYVPDEQDAYMAEELYHGKAEAAIEDARANTMKPLLEAIRAAGLTVEQAGEYLYARHAAERNARIAAINPLFAEGGGSGMTDEQAELILDRYRNKPGVAKIAELVDALTAKHRALLVSAGLERPETVAAWEQMYEFYVPLKGKPGEPELPTPSRGRGFDVRGRTKAATGRRSRAKHVIANLLAQYETDLIRAQKAEVGRALLRFVEAHPDPELWQVDKVEHVGRINPATGLVEYRPDSRYKLADNVLVVKVGGVDHHITFHGNRGQRIAHAMKNLGAANAGQAVRAFAAVNRVLSALNTSLNPEFLISNLARDLQTAGINLAGTEADAVKLRILKDVPRAWRGIRRAQRGKPHEWAEHFEAFRKAGGLTGWIDAHHDIDRFHSQLERELKAHARRARDPRRLIELVGDFVQTENMAVENAVRLSAFVHARRIGMSEAKAASLAKNLTVNFNRRGEYGTLMNSLYLFYNASIQGQVRMLQALRSPKVRKIAGGIVVFAAVLDMLNRAIGGDDEDDEPYYDKIPSWVKERNIILMNPAGDGNYFTIPMPWGYNIFHAVGQQAGEAIDASMGRKRDYRPLDSAMTVLSAVAGAFNPLGSGGSIGQLVSPTITDPVVAIGENRDWSGRPIRPGENPFERAPTPDSQKFWGTTGEVPRFIAERLNALTGGSQARPGLVDVSPTTLEYLYEYATGGAGRFLSDAVDAPLKQMIEGEVEAYRIPFVRRVYGEVGAQATAERFYRNLELIAYADEELKIARERKDRTEEARVRREQRAYLAARTRARVSEQRLRALRERRNAIRAQPMAESARRARLKTIEERMEREMLAFNKYLRDRL